MKKESILAVSNNFEVNIWDKDFNYKPTVSEEIERRNIKQRFLYDLQTFILKKTKEYDKELNKLN